MSDMTATAIKLSRRPPQNNIMPCHLAAAGTNFGIRREMLNDTINDITNAMINDAGIFFFLCIIISPF